MRLRHLCAVQEFNSKPERLRRDPQFNSEGVCGRSRDLGLGLSLAHIFRGHLSVATLDIPQVLNKARFLVLWFVSAHPFLSDRTHLTYIFRVHSFD